MGIKLFVEKNEETLKGDGEDYPEDRKLGRTASSVSEGQSSPSPFKRTLGTIAFILLAIAAFRFLFYPVTSTDIFRLIGYEMPSEVSALESRLNLTDFAKFTFSAVHPVLEDRDGFNKHCNSHDAEISILGCYSSDNHIYLYNIQSDELKGIVESTAAHELLHAAWDRLPFWEQQAVAKEIETYYNDHKEILSADLDIYSDDQLLDELHSRIGTEVANLPATLESHYAKYFTDQDAIVAYYDSYSAKFLELKDQIEELDTVLDVSEAELDALQATYDEREAAYNDRVDRFNACAETPDCFTDSEFTSQRAALLAERSELEQLLSELNDKVNAHNLIVDEYNANILRNQDLENSINSNADKVEQVNN